MQILFVIDNPDQDTNRFHPRCDIWTIDVVINSIFILVGVSQVKRSHGQRVPSVVGNLARTLLLGA